jgi:poly-gamma-glutamate synthesis protein (capsule biosynthesis protein)
MLLLSALMVLMGCALGLWTLTSIGRVLGAESGGAAVIAAPAPGGPAPAENGPSSGFLASNQPSPADRRPATILTSAQPSAPVEAAARARPVGLTVGVAEPVPDSFRAKLASVVLPGDKAVALVNGDALEQPLYLDWNAAGGSAIYTATFAAAVRFDTVFPATTWETIQATWAGDVTTYTAVSVLTSTLPALEQVLGDAGPTVQGVATVTDVVAAAWETGGTTLALLPFDHLTPSLAVLTIDGQTPIENAVKFDADAYPFVARLYAHTNRPSRSQRTMMQALLAALPTNNRDPAKVTTLTMTGVTAMVRFMAREMDTRGAAWPAEYVGEELSSADITHISNEVPFTEECKTDLRLDNFNFCTKAEYMETLRLSGVDIIGLTGNHQNDFGKKAALWSLDFYAKEGLPVYGGGRTVEEANRPLYVEHNGNRLAFLGANSYGPNMAWAEADWPGSARFDLNILSATIRAIKEKNLADVVLVELQYQESYDTMPLIDQRNDFNALVRAGADIVTGVQSHVPQGIEFTDGKLILYGLGNLYFDQMNSMPTRENMVAKHTFYGGRHISTQIETTLLYDFGQPRWMSDTEREALLNRVFAHSYWEY